jgi:hypothetical protein
VTQLFRVGNCTGFFGDRVDAPDPVVDTRGGQIEVLFHNAPVLWPRGGRT